MFVEHVRLVVCSERAPCAVRAKLETVTQATQGEHVQFSSCHHCCCHPQSPLSPDDGTFVYDHQLHVFGCWPWPLAYMYIACVFLLSQFILIVSLAHPTPAGRTNSVLSIKLLHLFLQRPNIILLKNRVFYYILVNIATSGSRPRRTFLILEFKSSAFMYKTCLTFNRHYNKQ